MDFLMIYSKFTYNIFFIGIYLVYAKYLLLKHLFKHSTNVIIICLFFCNKFFVMLLIVFIFFTYCKFSLNILMN